MKQRPAWTTIAIIIGLPVLLGFVWWLIEILSEASKWCGVPVGAARVTGQRLAIADCTTIMLALISALKLFGVALIATVCLSFIVIVIRDLRASIDVRGPDGTGFKAGGDPEASVTTTVKTEVKP